MERFGKSLVRLVHDVGFVDERMLVIHAIWVVTSTWICSPPRDAPWRTIRSVTCVWAAASCRSERCVIAALPSPSAPTNRSADDGVNCWATKQAGPGAPDRPARLSASAAAVGTAARRHIGRCTRQAHRQSGPHCARLLGRHHSHRSGLAGLHADERSAPAARLLAQRFGRGDDNGRRPCRHACRARAEHRRNVRCGRNSVRASLRSMRPSRRQRARHAARAILAGDVSTGSGNRRGIHTLGG